MNVVIRTDASLEIGTGHVMRCVTLAKQLEREGANITFVCRNFPGNSILFIQNLGFRVYTLVSHEDQSNWKWTRENWKHDVEETKQILKKLSVKTDLLIVDHYGLDAKWERELRSDVKHIMVIDDLADRYHDCDILLDQNYYLEMQNRYKGLVPDSCIQLLGPNHVLLRDEFLSIDPQKIKRDGDINNILVFFGGTDPTRETMKTLHAIQDLKRPDIEFNVIVGSANPQKEVIKKICDKMSNVIFHCQISNMAELMVDADLAIGAGGSTTWERCYLKLPSITVTVAENQRDIAHDVAKRGATIWLGESDQVTKNNIQEEVLKLLATSEKVVEVSSNCLFVLNPHKVKRHETMKNIRNFIYGN
ncbi:UDP-2,4-diacetamido-2,4,6-trideoxy-beta-L-altropyranose hydrolase [Bacillus sp. DTU_2020_1000418_1_SI_GHA_SEK_038]|uniref:UDP-2,4-diacetamido-2,4, 6-trideoxy-beta-L-altropyranose hydrolase n=1 Tax=Bacillus sp. DTU_2020_1000418_1_SI_GHA_SEK_038 TaxID=3077585 RepID=UPI0028EFE80E|nr:UDP-2,4-diacetamido-2,4,6-trideoxy-beta-L-altropyranose hydrolase [Bacillus sp. DTU_2020_1000418_1_SI_GHA_SEK_038]WNS75210.1 UDP-2,4-diacetamido-2,4,6-trideoxy-beta-L-altropyranose hydrolase [Bacillus sp. DTU_2020_1000418_1_SI_GHA_SEK_038]